jgi:hypothetical protein
MNTNAPARWWARGSSGGTAADTAADKRLYVEIGMVPVRCRSCGTEVLVKKNSDKHTSVQWTSDPVASCPQFAAAVEAGQRSEQYLGCPLLKQSIAQAVDDGTLVVPDA